jgi:hypothetical protein
MRHVTYVSSTPLFVGCLHSCSPYLECWFVGYLSPWVDMAPAIGLKWQTPYPAGPVSYAPLILIIYVLLYPVTMDSCPPCKCHIYCLAFGIFKINLINVSNKDPLSASRRDKLT